MRKDGHAKAAPSPAVGDPQERQSKESPLLVGAKHGETLTVSARCPLRLHMVDTSL